MLLLNSRKHERPKMTKQYFPAENAVVDADGIPAAIVAVKNGEPLVLLVSEEKINKFNAVKEKLGFTHVQFANLLKWVAWAQSSEFCEESVLGHLRLVEKQIQRSDLVTAMFFKTAPRGV